MPVIPRNKFRKLPQSPGVYLMRDASKKILYIGKAVNLRRRVSSYFQRPQEARIERMVAAVQNVEFRPTDTAIEALILEANLIKKIQPPFNIREKDDKSFLYVVIPREKFPRVMLARGQELSGARPGKFLAIFGPFTSGGATREALKIIRRLFSFSTHDPRSLPLKKACFDRQIHLCPGTCTGEITPQEYRKTIRNIIRFFQGKKKTILGEYQKDMRRAVKNLEFEKAGELKHKIFALQHIQDVALIKADEPELPDPKTAEKATRIEGYDISNINGTAAVGSLVVFLNGQPVKDLYRKFKIKTVRGANDTAMLREVLLRRLNHREWPEPDLILVDGGAPQVNSARAVLEHLGKKIPLIGLAKGPERRRNDLIGDIPAGVSLATLIRVRDEAHRFAISFHRRVRATKYKV